MMLSLRLALRYLVSRKSHGVVNVISAVSVAGVAVATAAIVVVLSVFNGFSDLARGHFSLLDPDLLITPVKGKVIAQADSLSNAISADQDVAMALPSLTERGLLVGDGKQLGVVFKGVDRQEYRRLVNLDSAVQAGASFNPDYLIDGEQLSDMAVGVAMRMELVPGVSRSELYVPRRVGRINPANPAGAFYSVPLVLGNVLAINQTEFDADHIIIPIEAARDILCYDNGEASAIEVKAAPGVKIGALRRSLSDSLGPEYLVADRDLQHQDSFRMIAVEKWVTFAMLVFILVIAAFNIVSTLSLMVIEKRDNMTTLSFLGAPSSTIRGVFMWMGGLITFAGGIAGTALGAFLAWLQQVAGIIKLSGDPSQLAVTVYPVRVAWGDLVAVLALVAVLSLVISATTVAFTSRIGSKPANP